MRFYQGYNEYKKIISLLLLLVLFIIITFSIKYYFKPFFIIIVLFILAKPIYDFMLKTTINKNIAGALSILVLNVVAFCIIFYFGNSIILNLYKLYLNNSSTILNFIDNIKSIFNIDISGNINGIYSIFTADNLKAGVGITGSSILTYIIANITVYFLLIDIKLFSKVLFILFPFEVIEKAIERKNNLKEVIKIEGALVLLCTFIIIIGFKILRVPSGIFLGVICGILDILPYVGTIIVFIPIIIYNIVMKDYLVVIGLVALYLLSQIIREILELKFLSSRLDIHPLVIMLSIYVGAEIFGIIGVLVGPIYCLIAKDIIYDRQT